MPVTALENISLDVEDKEFSVIVGPSGCGKTSLLRLVAGLIGPTEGTIRLDSTRIGGPGKDRGMVFQSYTLFPWLTVQDNVEFGLRIGGVPSAQRREIAQRFIAQVGLEGFERRYPKQLSGGMMQRAALARALANDPAILLMDEPFGALDEMTRERLNGELLNVCGETGATALFVTHSISEAVFLSTRVVVLSPRPGRIARVVDVDLPRPRNEKTRALPRFFELVTTVREHLVEDPALAPGPEGPRAARS